MAVRKIYTYPSEVLRAKASSVEKVDDDILTVLDDMIETIDSAPESVGLAAPQIGISKRLIAVDLKDGKRYKMINPVIIKREGKHLSSEGCLSVPNICVSVERAEEVEVSFLNESGEKIDLKAEGLFAVVIQHEIDHLDGKLIIDFAGPIKRDLYLKKLKQKKEICRQL